MKKETVYEAAEKQYSTIHEQYQYDAFIEGAKWQQEQDREMEKERIIDAFDTGRRKGDWIFDGEKYYNETFENS